MKKYNAFLVFLISSLAITGISFIDGKIWDVIFIIVGMIAYSLVGVLFSIGVLHGKQAGRDAYAFIFFLLVLGGYAVYKGLIKIKLWILSWTLFVKILVPIIIFLSILLFVFLRQKRYPKWIYKFKGRKNRFVLGNLSKKNGKTIIWVGVNPSTAKPENLDKTLKNVKCITSFNDYDNWIMLNLYPQRATNPDDMDKTVNDDLLQSNINWIRKINNKFCNADVVLAYGDLIEKREYLIKSLKEIIKIFNGHNFKCLGKTVNGNPIHPLYQKKESILVNFNIEEIEKEK